MSDETTPSTSEDSDTEHEITAAEQRHRANMQLRQALVSAIDSTLGGGQDKYETFNWDTNPTVEQFYGMYLRNAYARAICDMPVEATWRDAPEIVDHAEPDDSTGDSETDFEQAVAALFDAQRVAHYLKRGDVLSGIGEFGVIVLEFSDTDAPDDFATEVTPSESLELTGLRPFSQASVTEIDVGGPGSGRWGEPVSYELDLTDEDDAVTQPGPDELEVHHSRVLHIPADGLLDDEIRGTPRQEPVWNNLTDIEKALGSAGELAYRASAWGLNVNIDSDYQLEDGGDAMDEHLQRWYYGLEPILQTQGADEVQSLGGEEIDPKLVIDPNVEAISAQVGIPQSVLKGNETGERATEQDLKEWYGKIQSRREEIVTPTIVRELIDRLLEYGVLPEPAGDGYDVEWEPLAEADQQEIADTEKTRAEVLETWPFIEEVLTTNQQREYIEDGSLPSELDELGVPESDLEPPEFSMGETPPAPGGPPVAPDGGEEPDSGSEE